jgi:hypothetical protein
VNPRARVQLQKLGKLKKIYYLIWIQIHDLLACGIVSQPTTIPRAPKSETLRNIKLENKQIMALNQQAQSVRYLNA